MRQMSAEKVRSRKVTELGLDPETTDILSSEATAAALRRAAGLMCPCSAATLARNVWGPLRWLSDDLEATKKTVTEVLKNLIDHGDMFEYRDLEERSGPPMLYTAPPSFVVRESGAAIILGIESDRCALPEELRNRLERSRHARRISPVEGENLRDCLTEFGFLEISHDQWLKVPKTETPASRLSRFDKLLDKSGPSGEVPGLRLLDPELPVRFYKGRWREPDGRSSGRFVARREQAYGADLWCYVQMNEGNPEKLIDLPAHKTRWEARDEAWHLQMAIDSQRGNPQQFRMRTGTGGARVIEFFSPVPGWAESRWEAVGEPAGGPGHLFAYGFPETELDEELRFVREKLWLEEFSGEEE